MIEIDDCTHDNVDPEERIGGIPFGYCYDCQSTVQQTGLDDEDGNPGWELCE